MSFDNILQNLNASQHAAVSSFADTLAILAGPGSGKTHTLTSRTAWLLHQGLQPWNIIVATFTVKAAREMKERIGKLIGNGLESKLVLGTFHSISRRYLARYGHLINIRKDFGIADSGDSLAIIKRIVKRRSLNIDPAAARSRISSRKAKGDRDVRPTSTAAAKSLDVQEFEICYTEYEEALNRSNLLDYDDLLLRCVELLRAHPSCVSNVEAVLIDEFQDTNLVQFDLMRLFASQRKRITIVGDPDQSIYGFRSAETKNFKRMQAQYPETVTVALEENYRSSGAILLTALGVIEQDKSRIAKSLMPTHTVGTRPVLRKLVNAHKEAEWLVSEIQRCLGLTGGLMDLNDFAILLRSASLSRLIESALGKAGIAYRMVGGHRFYDRVEVKVVLDYLRVINQPDNNDALARIINIPSRRIGETTIKALLEEADQSSTTLWSLIIDKVQGNRAIKTKLNSETERSITKFVDVILTARQKIKDSPDGNFSTVELMDYMLRRTSFHDWLERKYSEDCDTRWANIQELRTQAGDFEAQVSEDDEEALPEIEGLQQDNLSNPLSKFLANVALASGKEEKEDGPSVPQVTISTIHAAKGLEWPVVFIPAAYQGSIPHSRAEDANEERRLLYVAMTRAKALLYMSLPLKSSQGEETVLSPFLAPLSLAPLLDKKGPTLGSSAVETISQILGRSSPSAEAISKSSSNLRCLEDSLFTVEGIEDNSSKWARWEGQQDFDIESRLHRRQTESTTAENRVELPWKGPSYATTMDKISNFTTGGFVSAGSHLNVLDSVSLNQVADFPEKTSKSASVKPTKRDEGQKSILGFVGKSEPQLAQKPKVSKPLAPIPNPYASPRTNVRVDVASHNAMLGFPPSLGNHQVGPTKSSKRPQPAHLEEPQKRNEYVFLSSSPPRPKRSKLEHEIPSSPTAIAPSLSVTTKPSILPLIRPPKSGLKRSISDIQKSGINDENLELPPLPRPASRELKRSHSESTPIIVKSKSKPKFELIPELPVGCSARTLHKTAESISKSTRQQTQQISNPTAIISKSLPKEVEAVLKETISTSEPTKLMPSSLGKTYPVTPGHSTTMQQPLTRPATTFHNTTTMSMLQGTGTGTGKKTLGVRRSMTGWQSQKGKGGFKPPTMAKRVG